MSFFIRFSDMIFPFSFEQHGERFSLTLVKPQNIPKLNSDSVIPAVLDK